MCLGRYVSLLVMVEELVDFEVVEQEVVEQAVVEDWEVVVDLEMGCIWRSWLEEAMVEVSYTSGISSAAGVGGFADHRNDDFGNEPQMIKRQKTENVGRIRQISRQP